MENTKTASSADSKTTPVDTKIARVILNNLSVDDSFISHLVGMTPKEAEESARLAYEDFNFSEDTPGDLFVQDEAGGMYCLSFVPVFRLCTAEDLVSQFPDGDPTPDNDIECNACGASWKSDACMPLSAEDKLKLQPGDTVPYGYCPACGGHCMP